MGYQEKKSILLAITQVLLTIGYFWHVAGQYAALAPDADLLLFWAKTIVVMVPVFMAGHITALIVFTILNKQITGESVPKFQDERDKLIELKATRIEYFTIILGVFASMVYVWRGDGLTTMFIVLITGLVLSGFLTQMTRIILYRLDA